MGYTALTQAIQRAIKTQQLKTELKDTAHRNKSLLNLLNVFIKHLGDHL